MVTLRVGDELVPVEVPVVVCLLTVVPPEVDPDVEVLRLAELLEVVEVLRPAEELLPEVVPVLLLPVVVLRRTWLEVLVEGVAVVVLRDADPDVVDVLLAAAPEELLEVVEALRLAELLEVVEVLRPVEELLPEVVPVLLLPVVVLRRTWLEVLVEGAAVVVLLLVEPDVTVDALLPEVVAALLETVPEVVELLLDAVVARVAEVPEFVLVDEPEVVVVVVLRLV